MTGPKHPECLSTLVPEPAPPEPPPSCICGLHSWRLVEKGDWVCQRPGCGRVWNAALGYKVGPAFAKHDAEKVRVDLLPPKALLAVGRVLTVGARKYAPDNWRKIPKEERHRYTAAAMRHLLAVMDGQETDPETGESHWAHLACCALFQLEFHVEEKGSK